MSQGPFDEAALRDPNHPSHRSGGREEFWAFGLVFLVGLVVLLPLGLSGVLLHMAVIGLVCVSVGAGFAVGWLIGRAHRTGSKTLRAQVREQTAAERERQLAEAKARGDFDWFRRG